MSTSITKRPVVSLTNKITFSAAHRLHSKQLDEEKNRQIYKRCNNINGHGHNYKVEVTVRGPVDSITGMVMNVTNLKEIMHTAVIDVFDHKNINIDVPSFRDTALVSTMENITIEIFNGIKDHLPSHTSLYEVKVHESDNSYSVFNGMYE